MKLQQQDKQNENPNNILDAIKRLYLSSYERELLFIIWRRTSGWHKKEDKINVYQFIDTEGTVHPDIARKMDKLVRLNVLFKSPSEDKSSQFSKLSQYTLNEHYELWHFYSSQGKI